MPPKQKFKKLDMEGYGPKKPAPSPFPTFVPGGGYGQNYDSGSSNNVSGASTPLQGSSSSISLASLASALKDVENTPATEYFEKIVHSKAISDVRSAVNELLELIENGGGPQAIDQYNIHEHLVSLTKTKGSALAREGSMVALSSIAKKYGPDHPVEAFLLHSFTIPFDLLADKESSVKRAAQSCTDSLYALYPDEAKVSCVLNKIFEYLGTSAKWQGKIGALKVVERILEDVPQDFLETTFVDAIPVLTNVMHDMKPELSKAATKTLTEFGNKLDNQDVVPRVPLIVQTLDDPKNVQNCVKSLSQVTFVTEVTESALSLLVPILNRAINATSSTQESLRQTVIVVENLTRLVHNPREVKAFIPDLLPGVTKIVETASQPEVRELAGKAKAVLAEAEKDVGAKTRITKEEAAAQVADEPSYVLRDYVTNLVNIDVNTREFKKLESAFTTYLAWDDQKAKEKVAYFKGLFVDSAQADEEAGQGEVEVVNAQFSLAYGGKMLLNKTNLRLFKGHRYGLCGRNGCGKSTLMRSIAEGKLEGFPDETELRTCFVEHKLQGSEAEMNIADFIASDPELASSTREEISVALAEVGFDSERQAQKVGSLSGGWKMKLELARAVLMKADVLLLDEPTNHLDVANVKWLVDYLSTHTNITSLIVSHDSGFLDAVCTDIVHYESKKLVYYKGNLSEFVKIKPEGKAYYTLTDSNMKMAFPPPGILSGVRSSTRAIARLTNVNYSYPGASKKSLETTSCSLSLSSRVAVVGPNGAGKSTLIKLLTGEIVPTEGSVEKHPNLRIGYIAQHALQHVEMHKEKTANQYLQWRYWTGDDREVHLKQTRKMSEEERAQMEKPVDIGDGGSPRIVEALIGRQKFKKSFQYEIKWKNMLPKYNTFVTKEFLLERGFNKLVQEFDDHEASREGLGYRELSPPVIRKHFEDVGLDGDIADHTPMGSLSGGQLVKVVIAGAMWNNPHLLVLDEPTNYLDRDSLGGLAVAIREWSGGVVMISHNEEFVGALCPEKWYVDNGRVVQKGKTAVDGSRFEDNNSSTPSTANNSDADTSNNANNDSPANIKVKKKKKKLTRNEMKEREARRRLRYIEWLNTPKGTPKPVDTDDEAD